LGTVGTYLSASTRCFGGDSVRSHWQKIASHKNGPDQFDDSLAAIFGLPNHSPDRRYSGGGGLGRWADSHAAFCDKLARNQVGNLRGGNRPWDGRNTPSHSFPVRTGADKDRRNQSAANPRYCRAGNRAPANHVSNVFRSSEETGQGRPCGAPVQLEFSKWHSPHFPNPWQPLSHRRPGHVELPHHWGAFQASNPPERLQDPMSALSMLSQSCGSPRRP
jgi:hypothetical protein